MAKLPTTFQSLDLSGFQIEEKQYSAVTREMVDTACAVLQKNRIGVVIRSVQAALKFIYGIGGSSDTVCGLLREWRNDHLLLLKAGRGEKDIVSVILDATDDGLLDELDIPEEYLMATRQMAIASYRLAYQKADTSVSGERMKVLTSDNDLLQQQLKDFPRLQLELNFYKSEYERQRSELKEAYINLNKQQLADSEQFRQQLDSLHQERNDLLVKLNSAVGEKQVLESQLSTLQSQLKDANETITRLESQQKSTSETANDPSPKLVPLQKQRNSRHKNSG
ncbi:hypothetical protein PCC9214_05374 (plasmid) [Planktothrix tepida]|uniref:Uncharacterized protein n=1 Tax=Planktothrix tepida PCC 9214 TaxID=671072 RepID=A0A1J1LNV6_9CYAN|nr:hypothetical protein [Planktothrix tepida]CAD5988403.1 hypothetical protein PCC9214_05374 [Planktothrix tepida]CUR33926.1 conserved hypothetical protein [Planktothrix tepida PCC 9214]